MSLVVVLCACCNVGNRPENLRMMRIEEPDQGVSVEGPYCGDCVFEETERVDFLGGRVIETAPVQIVADHSFSAGPFTREQLERVMEWARRSEGESYEWRDGSE